MKRLLLIGILLGWVAVLIGKSLPSRIHHADGRAMGTSWKLAWRGSDSPDLRAEVSLVLEHWEQTLSHWRENSDLSRHNRGESASPELARVIALAEEIRIASGGAFDHRLLEQVHRAGFGPRGKGIDLSGIGKGFAADRVGDRLRELGVNDFIFELGGEILAGDGPWEVEIEPPVPGSSETGRKFILRNRALATSGNYQQHVMEGDLLKSHLIDPRTGQPVLRPPSSVSVTAPDCATADAWATALFIHEPDFAGFPSGLTVRWQSGR